MKLLPLLALIFALASSAVAQSCDPLILSARGQGVEARFDVEVVETPQDKARGLMFRESLPMFSGMLFVYDRPQRVSFWMRNTLIPLDMVFIGADGVVLNVHANAQPLDETGIPGGSDDIQYVLEVNGGLARMLNIVPGVVIQHPAIDSTLAAWPCDTSAD
ncbi:MAG: DUF192 domain-containing protein [Paracoccaceae bacterium]